MDTLTRVQLDGKRYAVLTSDVERAEALIRQTEAEWQRPMRSRERIGLIWKNHQTWALRYVRAVVQAITERETSA